MPTLVLTPRYTEDSQALWKAAASRGWSVVRLNGWHVPEYLKAKKDLVLYVEALFGPTIAEQLDLRLVDPPEDWLVRLPMKYKLRNIHLITLGQARLLEEARFIKPPNDKSFPAAVYVGSSLPREFDDDMVVLMSDVVSWKTEFRCFVLDRSLVTYSIYARDGELQREVQYHSELDEDADLEKFMNEFLADPSVDLPSATVVDVGYIEGSGWACVEQNAAWGAGLYGCEPSRVLDVVRYAVERAFG
jgi:hypothetical protein